MLLRHLLLMLVRFLLSLLVAYNARCCGIPLWLSAYRRMTDTIAWPVRHVAHTGNSTWNGSSEVTIILPSESPLEHRADAVSSSALVVSGTLRIRSHITNTSLLRRTTFRSLLSTWEKESSTSSVSRVFSTRLSFIIFRIRKVVATQRECRRCDRSSPSVLSRTSPFTNRGSVSDAPSSCSYKAVA